MSWWKESALFLKCFEPPVSSLAALGSVSDTLQDFSPSESRALYFFPGPMLPCTPENITIQIEHHSIWRILHEASWLMPSIKQHTELRGIQLSCPHNLQSLSPGRNWCFVKDAQPLSWVMSRLSADYEHLKGLGNSNWDLGVTHLCFCLRPGL